MRVLKDINQSFLAGVLGLQDKLIFVASCFLFFDLEHPKTPLPEKDLWKLIKQYDLKSPPFDTGMPKPQAEAVLYGACHTTAGPEEECSGAEVSLEIGTIRKRLFVYGPRHWEIKKRGLRIVHDAPLSGPVPLTWENAFGGPDFPDNPKGLGFISQDDGHAGTAHFLPRVEYPDQLVGSPEDLPEPASLAPMEQMRPRRLKRAGTYDATWFHNHWPFYPPDFDMRFFNTVPEDQQIKGYFKGDEVMRLQGLHPSRPLIESRLPGLKIRCFATLTEDIHHPKQTEKTRFLELATHLDTVWLFPGELRGACCFRGLCEIIDEEYRDVINVLLVTESLNETAHSLEYYQDLRDRWVERAVHRDNDSLEKGKQSVADALNRLNNLPVEMQAGMDKILGKKPHVPISPQQQLAKAHSRIDAAAMRLDSMETLALALRKKHGHIVPVNLDHFTRTREHIVKQRARLGSLEKGFSEALARKSVLLGEASQHAVQQKKSLQAKGEELDFDPVDPFLPPKEKRWGKSVLQNLRPWREELLHTTALYQALLNLGLTEKTIADAWLGFNTQAIEADRRSWGLEPKDRPFIIPAGLVIPQFEGAVPVALRIHPLAADFSFSIPMGDAELVEGSALESKAPFLASGAAGRLLVRVHDPLEALLLSQEAGDLCAAIVLGGPDFSLGAAGEALLKEAPAFVVALPGATSIHEASQWKGWSTHYPQARPLLLPKGGFIQAGLQEQNIRTLIRELVPLDAAGQLPSDPGIFLSGDIKPGMQLPVPQVKKIVAGARTQATNSMEAKLAHLKKKSEEIVSLARSHAENIFKQHNLDPKQFLDFSKQKQSLDLGREKTKMLVALDSAKRKLIRDNQLTPEMDEQIQDMGAMFGALLDKADKSLAGLSAITTPDWAKKIRERHGLAPETGSGLTREAVLAKLEAGDKNFARQNLSGLDLSGLDFTNANLERTLCLKTRFNGCVLRGAVLSHAVCKEATFDNADLSGGDLTNCMLQKALLRGAELRDAHLAGVLLLETDCTGGNFANADLSRSVLQKAKLGEVSFAGAKVEHSLFTQAAFGANNFAETNFNQSVFKNCSLDNLNFSESMLQKASFVGCCGEKVVFSNANMENARFYHSCSLPDASFVKTRLLKASAMDSSLLGCDFREALLDNALFQNCDLCKAVFTCARARYANFSLCDLEKADLRGIDLLQGSLRKARLVKTDCTGANLFGVDFFKAVMNGAILDQADTKRTLIEKREHLLPHSDSKPEESQP